MFGSLPARKEARASERIRPRRCVIYFLRLPHNYSALWRCGPLWPPKGFKSFLLMRTYIHVKFYHGDDGRKEAVLLNRFLHLHCERREKYVVSITSSARPRTSVRGPSVRLAELGGVERTKRQFVMISTGRSSLLPPLARSRLGRAHDVPSCGHFDLTDGSIYLLKLGRAYRNQARGGGMAAYIFNFNPLLTVVASLSARRTLRVQDFAATSFAARLIFQLAPESHFPDARRACASRAPRPRFL